MLAFGSLSLSAADWPQWRGVNRDGKSAETGLLKQWPEKGPALVWKAQGLGEGYASFAVVGSMLYTQGQRGSREYVMAFDVANGKKLWEVDNGASFNESRGNGPRGAPTVEGERLWAYSADGTISCLEIGTGRKIWQFNALGKFGGSIPPWGISESPLIDGDRVIIVTGGSGASVVALNKVTGETIWKSGNDDVAYSSAILVETGGIRQILTFTAEAAVGLRADNGHPLWRYPRVANGTANIATPVFSNGHAFYSSAYGTGASLLRLTGDGKASEVYFTREMKNHYSSSVLVGDTLYGFSDSILTAMKMMTGDVAWRDRSVGKGSVILADGLLYCSGENGTVGLVEPSPAGYKERSRFSIEIGRFPMWTLPVVANGRLYIRDQDNLYAYDVRAR